MTLRLFIIAIETFWSSCGDVSRALLMAAPDGSVIVMKFGCWVSKSLREEVSVLSPTWRAQRRESDSVTVSLNTLSLWLHSLPFL